MIFRLFKKKPIDLQAFQEQFSANWRARTGADTRPKKLPAWALLMRSPYKSYSEPTSWLGGVPRVPHSFEWPMGDDHLPLHFIAQIDLAALKPEPTSGAPAPGLPSEGALLVFIGQGYAVRLISSHDMATATFATPP